MKIFRDQELNEEIGPSVNFGIVLAGQVKEMSCYLFNETNGDVVDLQIIVDHPQVEVVSAPSALAAKESKELKLRWKPSVDLKRGLSANLKIHGYEVYS